MIGKSSTRSGSDSERDDTIEISEVTSRPGRRTDACQLEHAIRARPGRECRELVGTDQEHGIVEAERLERVDRAAERIEGDLGLVERREGELGERAA